MSKKQEDEHEKRRRQPKAGFNLPTVTYCTWFCKVCQSCKSTNACVFQILKWQRSCHIFHHYVSKNCTVTILDNVQTIQWSHVGSFKHLDKVCVFRAETQQHLWCRTQSSSASHDLDSSQRLLMNLMTCASLNNIEKDFDSSELWLHLDSSLWTWRRVWSPTNNKRRHAGWECLSDWKCLDGVLVGLRSSFILVILVFPWFFLWCQHEVDVCGFEWNDSITPGYIAMKNIVCSRWIITLWWAPDFLVLAILLFGWWPNSYKVTPTPTILSCS